MATATKTRTTRGYAAPCIRCNETNVQVSLDDLDSFMCGSCGESFGRDDIEAIVKIWAKVLTWLDTAPPLADTDD